MKFWKYIYKSNNEESRNIPETKWIFDEFPHQDAIPTQIEKEIPSHIRDIVLEVKVILSTYRI